jgi:hypothetical protein
MHINNTIIRVSNDYKIDTTLDVQYYQLSNGNYTAITRGSDADIYNTSIKTYGTEAYISGVITMLDTAFNTSGLLTMSGFSSDETLWGDNIDYTAPLSGIVTEYGMLEQNSLNVYSLSLNIRLLDPVFTGSASLPDFTTSCVSIGYKADIIRSFSISDTYYGSVTLNNMLRDAGMFTGLFNLTRDEVKGLRQWLRLNRTDTTTIIGLNGVSGLFGPVGGSYHHTVRILDFKEEETFGIDRWLCKITLVKEY